MKKQTKKTKDKKTKNTNKKNLTVTNHGDVVVIRNRSTVAASVLGAIVLGVAAFGVFSLKEAWDFPLFWLIFGLLVAAAIHSFANMIFAKVVLDSPKKTITVYNPSPSTYKFEDINYVDMKKVKSADGTALHVVTAYIGDGRRSVEISSYSEKQAQEISALMRGMLDNAAMVYPEYELECYSQEASENAGEDREFHFIRRTRKTDKDSEASVPSDTVKRENDAEDIKREEQ
jgi:hypothetical protein